MYCKILKEKQEFNDKFAINTATNGFFSLLSNLLIFCINQSVV